MMIDDDLDCGPPQAVPPRSVLFALAPSGAGTAQQESLISLIVRTSRAHAVNPRQLISKVFLEANSALAKQTTPFFGRDGGTVNGLGQYAELFASAMSKLSGQTDLNYLTLLPWKDIFPRNGQGLLSRHRKWCPVCLNEQRGSVEGTIFPLSWSLELHTVCPAHQVSMESRCPSCERLQPFFPRYPDLAICHHCRRFLAVSRPRENRSHYELWVAEAIGDMMRHQSKAELAPAFRRFQEFVSMQVLTMTGGNRAAFCRSLGFNSHGVRGWLDRNERPSITQFLAFCYGLKVMPSDIFNETPHQACLALINPAGKLKERASCPRPTLEQRRQIKALLEEKLASPLRRPVTSIAAEIGVRPSCLRYWYPDLCRTLSNLNRSAVKELAAENHALQCERVWEVVRQIQAEGEYPSRRRVNSVLHRERMSLALPHLLEAYLNVLHKR